MNPAPPPPPPLASPANPAPALDQLLRPVAPRARRARWWALAALLLALALGAGLWRARQAEQAAPVYVTEPAQRIKLTQTVTANGTLQPTSTVNIGSELSGTVAQVRVDINDRVRKGQVLIELDASRWQDQVLRSQAALQTAQGQLAQAQASLLEAQQTQDRLAELARLSAGQLPTASERDTASANLARAQANLSSAQAGVASAQAALATDQTNLSKAAIRSPIDGVVLTRSVDPGNAVAASLQAVTLLTLAQDLRQMQLKAAIDEADVARVQLGQKASFTVSAFGARRFAALVQRVSYGSTITDNVVTYSALLDVQNPDLALRPGMTATATLVAAERENALVVPNSALRYSPAGAAEPKGERSKVVATMLPRLPRQGARKASGGVPKQVWVLRDGAPLAVPIEVGISDGRYTEIVGGELSAGQAVITEQRSAAASR